MFKVDKIKCIGCGTCLNVCPVGVISMINEKAEIDINKCRDCEKCAQACPQGAIYPGERIQQNFYPNQKQIVPPSGFGTRGGQGRGMKRGMGHGFGRGPRIGRGRGRGGGGKRR